MKKLIITTAIAMTPFVAMADDVPSLADVIATQGEEAVVATVGDEGISVDVDTVREQIQTSDLDDAIIEIITDLDDEALVGAAEALNTGQIDVDTLATVLDIIETEGYSIHDDLETLSEILTDEQIAVLDSVDLGE